MNTTMNCGYYNHKYELKDGLILKSVQISTKEIIAKVHLVCPECGHTVYYTLRSELK